MTAERDDEPRARAALCPLRVASPSPARPLVRRTVVNR